MFQARTKTSSAGNAVSLLELIYHSTVREMRKTHGSAVIGLLSSVLQSVIMLGSFYVMFSVLGLRGSAVRGDFMLYVMSGIFLFMTHTKGMGAVAGSEGPASAMMQHSPMNTVIAITSSALASLYTQTLTMFVILFLYHSLATPFVIDDPVGAFAMFLLAWFSGVAVGMVFLALKPWFPGFVAVATTIYARANMIASGKMFLANAMPSYMLAMFDWNPLFHAIDQSRGFAFINYNPHNSTIEYALTVSLALIMIGLMGEFFTRKHASQSWFARR
jgi:ABC-type polysaccharide/polyol phosphate export permease